MSAFLAHHDVWVGVSTERLALWQPQGKPLWERRQPVLYFYGSILLRALISKIIVILTKKDLVDLVIMCKSFVS
jgi:hypothetical protein